MNDTALFEATVPVFRHYLECVKLLLTKLSDEQEPLLEERLATHTFTASEHLQTAIGFIARTVQPLLGGDVSGSEHQVLSRSDLVRLVDQTDTQLRNMAVGDFDGASARVIQHTAGAAELSQSATTFVTTFALPNFFFHVSMAFAILRHGGANIGKADFDGQHCYAADFHF